MNHNYYKLKYIKLRDDCYVFSILFETKMLLLACANFNSEQNLVILILSARVWAHLFDSWP